MPIYQSIDFVVALVTRVIALRFQWRIPEGNVNFARQVTTVEWLTPLHRIWQAAGSNLGSETRYPDNISWFYLVTLRKCADSALK
jgi:hypothetical protein